MKISFLIFESNKISYKDFFILDQNLFKTAPSYKEYFKQLKKYSKDTIESQWLFNHHAAELAFEQNFIEKAKHHIEIAKKLNPFDNKITVVLYFIINKTIDKDLLVEFINNEISDLIEKETAFKLMDLYMEKY